MTKTWIIIAIAVCIAGIGGGAVLLHQRDIAPAADTPSDTFVATVSRGDIVQSVQATGPVASNLDVAIKCLAGGLVTYFPYDISDKVEKGDVLLKIDPVDEQVFVDQANANLAMAQSQETEAKETEKQAELDLQTATEQAETNITAAQTADVNLRKTAQRQEELLKQNLTAPQTCESAETDAAQADTNLRNAQIAKQELKSQAVALEVKKENIKLATQQVNLDGITLKNAKQQMSYCTVSAPMDGTVAAVSIQVGTIISSATTNVGGGTSVMTISDMSHIFVLATVDESDIGEVADGQKVDITADAYPGHHFSGKVVRIALQGVNTSNVVTFEVKVEVTSPDKDLLKPQMTGTVQIIEASRQNVLMVPMLAIVHRKGTTFVQVIKPDGTTEDRPVQAGVNDGENQEIVSGQLEVGEKILAHKNESSGVWNENGVRKQQTGGKH